MEAIDLELERVSEHKFVSPLYYDWRWWYGGYAPLAHEKVEVDWGSYSRVYERADMVAWNNLPIDGRYCWRYV